MVAPALNINNPFYSHPFTGVEEVSNRTEDGTIWLSTPLAEIAIAKGHPTLEVGKGWATFKEPVYANVTEYGSIEFSNNSITELIPYQSE